MIEGGFPKGSLILLAGNPGTGKTVFGVSFICKGGRDLDEAGVHVSFAENEETLKGNMSQQLDRNCEKCVKNGKCRFLDLVTVKEEGTSTVLELILAEVQKLKAKRLVIDSYTAMAQAFKEKKDSRIIIHTVLGKLVRRMGCTPILISEAPRGQEQIGMGIEEFVADGVILLKTMELDERPLREMEILKMRGTRLTQNKILYSLDGGFNAFQSLQPKPVEKPKRFQPIKDSPDMFSSGLPQLDEILKGGYPKGSIVLFEVGATVPTDGYTLLVNPCCWNVVTQGNPVVVIPSVGVGAASIAEQMMTQGLVSEDEVNRLLRICIAERDLGAETAKPPFIWTYGVENIRASPENYFKMTKELTQNHRYRSLGIVGTDTLFSQFGETLTEFLNTYINLTRANRDLFFLLLRPGISDPSIYEMLRATSEMHFRFVREHGVLLFYGVKPRTGLYAVDVDTSQGYLLPKFTPMV